MDAALREEVGWVLGNARAHAPDHEMRTAKTFAEALDPPVHRAQVGRWEGGTTAVTHRTVSEYERVLDLPAGQLLTMVDILTHERTPIGVTPYLAPRTTEHWWEETNDLLDRARSEERMSSYDWRLLAQLLTSNPDALLSRHDWEHLLRRCTEESALRTGLAYLQRDEAVTRLAGHERAARTVVQIADDTLSSPSAPVYIQATLLVCASPQTEAGAELLLRHLVRPVSDDALCSVLWALGILARDGGLTPDQRTRAIPPAVEVLLDTDVSQRLSRAAASLLCHLHRELGIVQRQRLVDRLTATDRPRLALMLTGGGALRDEELQTISREISRRLSASLGPRSQMAPTLKRLVTRGTALSGEESRGTPLGLLLLSPQGPVIGATYAAALRWAIGNGKEVLVDEALSVLSWLLPPGDLDTMLDLATDPSFGGPRRMQAAYAVGNVRPDAACLERGLTPQVVTGRAYDAAVAAMADPLQEAGPTARGLLYILGMYGRFDLVEGLRAPAAGPCVAPEWGAGMAAWLDVPGWVRPLP